MKIAAIVIALVILAVLAVVGWKSSRLAYETAPYSVIEKDGAFEIRDYPSLTLVSTKTAGGDGSDDKAFMRLFRYIAKDNEDQQKIAMTTPVFMTPGADGEMSFVVPEKVVKEGVPAPKSSQLTVKTSSMGKVAVYRYRGKWDQELRVEAREKLASWLEKKSLTASGDYFSAGYDPPFIPGFLRRNEALVRLE